MKRKGLLLLLMVAGLTACELQKVVVNIYTPPRLVYPPELRSFLVTSRYVPATGPYEDVQWGGYESVDSAKWALSESVIDTLGHRMIEGDRYRVRVIHHPRMLRNNDATLPDPQPWPGMMDLAKKQFVQAVLVVEGFDINKSPIGEKIDKGTCTDTFNIEVTLAIRTYEPEKMRLVDDSVYTFTSTFRGMGETPAEAKAQLPADTLAEREACGKAADAYFALIVPGEKTETRYFFSEGDSLLKVAAKAVGEGNWGRAESKWKWLAYNSKDTIIQAKASFNMALACERDGRTNQAIGYARRSERLSPDKHTTAYVELLDREIKAFDKKVEDGEIIKKW
jgi:hypothetical protein